MNPTWLAEVPGAWEALITTLFWVVAAVALVLQVWIVREVLQLRPRREPSTDPGAAGPLQRPGISRLEVVWTVAPAALLGALVIISFGALRATFS